MPMPAPRDHLDALGRTAWWNLWACARRRGTWRDHHVLGLELVCSMVSHHCRAMPALRLAGVRVEGGKPGFEDLAVDEPVVHPDERDAGRLSFIGPPRQER